MCTNVNSRSLEWADKYFKVSWNQDFLESNEKAFIALKKGLVSSQELLNLKKFNRTGKMEGIAYLSGKYGRKKVKGKKDAILSTISHHVTTTTGKSRMKLYELLTKNFSSKRDRLHLHVLDQRQQIIKTKFLWYQRYLFKSPKMEGKDPSNEYFFSKFVSESWFWLNLGGIGFSQPNRLEVACQYGAAVVSDYIYASWAKSFPAYYLDVDTELDIINETRLAYQIEYLLQNYESLFEKLYKEQNVWCRANFDPKYWLHFILRNVKNQPFKALIKDQEVLNFIYGKTNKFFS